MHNTCLYDKPLDSVRAFLKQKRQAQQATDEHDQSGLEEERLAAESITVGSRCEVTVPNAPPRRGLVMFVGNIYIIMTNNSLHNTLGKTQFKPGYWIGVKYDEPCGKNDGRQACVV